MKGECKPDRRDSCPWTTTTQSLQVPRGSGAQVLRTTPPWPAHTPPWPAHTSPLPVHTSLQPAHTPLWLVHIPAMASRHPTTTWTHPSVASTHPTVASTHPTAASTGCPVGEDVSGIVSPGPAAGPGPRLSAVGGPPHLQEGQGCFASLPPWVLWMLLGPEAHTPLAVTGPSAQLAPQPPQALPIGCHLTRCWTVKRVLLVECLQSGFF